MTVYAKHVHETCTETHPATAGARWHEPHCVECGADMDLADVAFARGCPKCGAAPNTWCVDALGLAYDPPTPDHPRVFHPERCVDPAYVLAHGHCADCREPVGNHHGESCRLSGIVGPSR